MLTQVPSDLGSLSLKNHTDENVNEVCIFRDTVFVHLFPIQVLCFEKSLLWRQNNHSIFNFQLPHLFFFFLFFFFALFSLLFPASSALKHDIGDLSFRINYLVHPGNMPVSRHGLHRHLISFILRFCCCFFLNSLIPRLSLLLKKVSFLPQLNFHDSFI